MAVQVHRHGRVSACLLPVPEARRQGLLARLPQSVFRPRRHQAWISPPLLIPPYICATLLSMTKPNRRPMPTHTAAGASSQLFHCRCISGHFNPETTPFVTPNGPNGPRPSYEVAQNGTVRNTFRRNHLSRAGSGPVSTSISAEQALARFRLSKPACPPQPPHHLP